MSVASIPADEPPDLRLVRTGGAGPAAVLVHGFGSDRMSWLANQGALQAARTVFTLDLPGHGAEALLERDLSAIADRLAASLQGAGLGPYDLVGHSLGGAVCTLVAASRPDLVRRLVLIAPAGLGREVDPTFLERYPRLTGPEEAEALLHRLVSRPRLINKQMVAHVLTQLGEPGRRQALESVATMLTGDGQDLADAFAAIARADLPRLVIWGSEDGINPLDEDRLRGFGGERHLAANAGHLPHVENSAEVNRRILAFLDDRSAGEA